MMSFDGVVIPAGVTVQFALVGVQQHLAGPTVIARLYSPSSMIALYRSSAHSPISCSSAVGDVSQ